MLITFSNAVLSFSLSYFIYFPFAPHTNKPTADYETIAGIHNNMTHKSHSHPNSPDPHTPVNGVLNSTQKVPDNISVFKDPQSPQTGSPITSSPALKRGMSQTMALPMN